MFEDNSQLCDIARAAEEIGFHGIAVADHVAVPNGFRSAHPSGENPFVSETNFPDPFTTIAAMGCEPGGWRTSTQVRPHFHHPATTRP
jgi:alkanesulfonate monooxygenase SsuD/methylene tetrahydromethanopterin reductase-like flavin-dependent oxidoreductase (luciferase family)